MPDDLNQKAWNSLLFDTESVVVNLHEVYGQAAPLLNLLITQELKAAVHLKQHIHSILEGAKLEKTLNQ